MQGPIRGEAPNYTTACLVMFGVNLAWIFTLIWAVWGFIFVILLGWFINHAITRYESRAMARAMPRHAPRR